MHFNIFDLFGRGGLLGKLSLKGRSCTAMVRTDGEAQLRSVLGALDENRRADNRQPFPQKVGVLPLKQRKGGRRPASPPTASSPSECRTRSAQLLSSSTIQGPAFREGSASPDAWCSSPDDSARNRYQNLQVSTDTTPNSPPLAHWLTANSAHQTDLTPFALLLLLLLLLLLILHNLFPPCNTTANTLIARRGRVGA